MVLHANEAFACGWFPADCLDLASFKLLPVRPSDSPTNSACYVARRGLSAVMANEKFDQSVTIIVDPAGGREAIGDAAACLDFLLRRWRGKRSDKHRAAIQACTDVNSGRRPASFARKAFIAAAREAAILVTP
ncbi:DUF982 domain-containing protein [Mesorhizobium sp. CA12]|uniref:DUF982 domain-containing protein n=1 Tax=Mesorhizobium sp. CA12 TaxID=2876644 RepID=UPI001CCE572F|nr:DUF982 domain-containing protein [Mesorhizobium sp. CA12]MBZ9861653.1 DUF982 domain-containing protein [Mesorhizobium sp. CA12]